MSSEVTTLEWQVASGSSRAHIIDVAAPGWHAASGCRRPSGPRALCGRYPQRNAEDPWFSLSVDDPGFDRAAGHYRLRVCDDCADRGAER